MPKMKKQEVKKTEFKKQEAKSQASSKEPEKKETHKDRLAKRKQILKDGFIKLLKKQTKKFDINQYILGSGGKGLLCEEVGFENYDRAMFKEILTEMVESGDLVHIGGTVYKAK